MKKQDTRLKAGLSDRGCLVLSVREGGYAPQSGIFRLSAGRWKRLGRGLFLSVFLPVALCFSAGVFAKTKVKRKKRVVIDFQDELLEGALSNPGIFHLFHKKQLDYGRLVKFRKNFLPEMRRTAREIK